MVGMYRVDNVDNKDDKGGASAADKFIAKKGIKQVEKDAGTTVKIDYEKDSKEFAETRATGEGEKLITSKGIVLLHFQTGATGNPGLNDINDMGFVFEAGLNVVSTASSQTSLLRIE